jgi:hypothetical protein
VEFLKLTSIISCYDPGELIVFCLTNDMEAVYPTHRGDKLVRKKVYYVDGRTLGSSSDG